MKRAWVMRCITGIKVKIQMIPICHDLLCIKIF